VKIDRRTRVAVEAVVSAVVLGLLLRWAGLHEVAKTLRGTDLSWFLPAVALSVATVPVMALRWQLLLEAKHVSVPLGWLTRTYFVALFAGQFLPAAIGGDAVRVVELGRRTGDAPEAVASVLIDRLVGLVSLVVLAIVAVLVSGGGRRPGVIAAEAAFGAAAAVALLLLFSSRLRGAVARWLEPRAAGRRLAVGGRFYEALHAYRAHRGTLVAVGLLALLVQAARVGVIWMLARALGLDVPDSVLLLAGPVVFAALALPVSLNGIGVREAVFVYFLHGHATRPEAIALGLAFFAVGTVTALGGAAVLVVRFIRYGFGAVRPRTGIGEPPGAKGD
jgi:glycosyltransferase 2 family protein